MNNLSIAHLSKILHMYVIHTVNSPCACIHVHIELDCLYIHGYIVFTGQRICSLEENCEVGNGTYSRNGYVYSSLAGYLQTSGGEDGKVVLSSHNYIHPMFQLIQLLTGFEVNKKVLFDPRTDLLPEAIGRGKQISLRVNKAAVVRETSL